MEKKKGRRKYLKMNEENKKNMNIKKNMKRGRKKDK